MKQSDIFLGGEGVAWFNRNKDKINPAKDPVVSLLKNHDLIPETVLEIGCADGWRLRLLQNLGATGYGVDPGFKEGRTMIGTIPIHRGTAHSLWMFGADDFDMVIFGWCLYLCDPEDYCKIVAESDRVLKNDGHVVIHDFYSAKPYKRPYKHNKDIYSHKMDFSRLWLGNPAYSLHLQSLYGDGEDQTCVTVLKKNMDAAFTVKP